VYRNNLRGPEDLARGANGGVGTHRPQRLETLA
jgi:hypothetical protein